MCVRGSGKDTGGKIKTSVEEEEKARKSRSKIREFTSREYQSRSQRVVKKSIARNVGRKKQRTENHKVSKSLEKIIGQS